MHFTFRVLARTLGNTSRYASSRRLAALRNSSISAGVLIPPDLVHHPVAVEEAHLRQQLAHFFHVRRAHVVFLDPDPFAIEALLLTLQSLLYGDSM
jgi:hypothetical protein